MNQLDNDTELRYIGHWLSINSVASAKLVLEKNLFLVHTGQTAMLFYFICKEFIDITFSQACE